MKKGLTEMVFILDRSGSMAGLEKETIGGFNALIEKQKAEEGEALVSVVLFDNVAEVLYDRIPLTEMKPMTEKQYYVRGCTALLDALGDGIKHIGNVHKYVREEDVPEHTIFVITTDGLENASRKYEVGEIKKMIEFRRQETGWDFIFLGANIDAVETAKSYGIPGNFAEEYVATEEGTRKCDYAMNERVTKSRSRGKNNRDLIKTLEEK